MTNLQQVTSPCKLVSFSESAPQQADKAAPQTEMLSEYPELLTVAHISELTGLREDTIRANINAGKLPGCKIGRRFFVPREQFVAFVWGGASA